MSRGKLDKETAEMIGRQLPDVESVRKASLAFNSNRISIGFPVGSSIPIAAVCL